MDRGAIIADISDIQKALDMEDALHRRAVIRPTAQAEYRLGGVGNNAAPAHPVRGFAEVPGDDPSASTRFQGTWVVSDNGNGNGNISGGWSSTNNGNTTICHA